MSLKSRIEEDFKHALKSKDRFAMDVLRMIKAEIKNREIEKKSELESGEVEAVVSSYVKKSRDAITLFEQGGRQDLAEKEKREIEFLGKYLPKQLSEEELRQKIKEVIAGIGSPGIQEMGKVMKAVMAEIGKSADGKVVSGIVKEYLQN